LNTLQVYGVHGRPLSTLQGACENGVASMWRGRASALPATVIPANAIIKQTTMRRSMTQAPRSQHNPRGCAIEMMCAAGGIKAGFVHNRAFIQPLSSPGLTG